MTSRNLGREEDNRLLGAEKSDTGDAHDISSGVIYGPRKNRSNGGVLIVYDCWDQLVITAYPCVAPLRFPQPDVDDDGWISS